MGPYPGNRIRVLALVLAAPAILLLFRSCRWPPATPPPPEKGATVKDAHTGRRERMVATQMRDVRDPAVLAAMARVPRHLFVPPRLREAAYDDSPLAIGRGQTISQPYIVARMTEAAGVSRGDRVLEVGTGSGYQAAVLAQLGCRVWSLEIIPQLHRSARANLKAAGYDRDITLRCGDGYLGWPEEAPFAAILVTAAPPEVPRALREQLAPGGRLVIPVGPQGGVQKLRVITRSGDRFVEETLFPVRFVPLVKRERKP